MRRATVCSNKLRPTSNLSRQLIKGLRSKSARRFAGTDVYEKDGNLNYELELPGLSKEDIEVTVEEGKLLISGSYEQSDESDRKYLVKGRKRDRVKRGFQLPEGLEDLENLNAEFDNGVLHLEVPIRDENSQGPIEVEIQ